MDVPLISIPTLDALAYQIIDTDGIIIPMLDARRMEVYSAIFNSNKEEVRETKAEVLDETTFNEYLVKEKVYFIGDGVVKFKDICSHKNAVFVENKYPSANEMGKLAELKYKKSDTENVAYFEPYYLKDFVTG